MNEETPAAETTRAHSHERKEGTAYTLGQTSDLALALHSGSSQPRAPMFFWRQHVLVALPPVKRHVLCVGRKEPQVLRAIIRRITVDVVNDFLAGERASEHVFHYKPRAKPPPDSPATIRAI